MLPDRVFVAGQEREFLSALDFLVLALPHTRQSGGLVGEEQLRALPRTAFLLNPARGPVVHEAALLRALAEGWIAGAALDVYAEEPPPPDHPLRRLPNCLALPHNAFNTVETAAAVNRAVQENVLAVVRGSRPPGLVNTDLAWK